MTDVTLDGHVLVLVEDTSTEGQDGQRQTIRGWAREISAEVEVTTLTTGAPAPTASLAQEAALGFVMLRGMAWGTARDELTTEVRKAARRGVRRGGPRGARRLGRSRDAYGTGALF